MSEYNERTPTIPDRVNLRLNKNDPLDVRFYLALKKARHKKEAIRDAFLAVYEGDQMVTTSNGLQMVGNPVNIKENDEIEEVDDDFLAALGL